MEKIINALFDYQAFEKNAKLEQIISESEARYARELSDEDLIAVNAAGDNANKKQDDSTSTSEGSESSKGTRERRII